MRRMPDAGAVLYIRVSIAPTFYGSGTRTKISGITCPQTGFAQLENKRILEIGCGNGDVLRDFIKWGARPENLFGVELIPERVDEAIHLCPKDVKIMQGNAAKLRFPDENVRHGTAVNCVYIRT